MCIRDSIIPVLELQDEFVRACLPRGFLHFAAGSPRPAVFNIFIYRAGKEVYLLLHHADLRAQGAQGNAPNILSIQ